MGVIIKAEDVFKLKSAALLHDPPHKPFLLVGKKGLKHEVEAVTLARTIFEDSLTSFLELRDGEVEVDERIRQADRLASSFDRWLLSLFMGRDYIYKAFKTDAVKLKNPLAPWLEVRIDVGGDVLQNKKEEYAEDLANILKEVKDWRWKYHLFYALYELLWIEKGLPVGPADTRVPTCTVFHHNYATVAVVNWLLEDSNRLRGLMVGVDIAGVQEFIRSSRKLRDMWSSSYIVSALAWYTVAELVEALGPDIVLMPSLGFNPFYIYWLISRVDGRGREELKKVEGLVYLVEDVLKMYRELGMPPYPVIPGRLTLILPHWSIVKEFVRGAQGFENVEEYLRDRFQKGWRILWKAIENLVRDVRLDGNTVWNVVSMVFKHYDEEFKDALFHEIPPLTLRVSSISVDEPVDYVVFWRIYDENYRRLTSKMALSKYSGTSPASQLYLKSLTLNAFEGGKKLGVPKGSEKGFDYCTSCGIVPAILILPGDEGEFDEAVGSLIARADLANFKVVFKPGEKLCPWCFVKRVISLEPRLLKVLLLGLTENDVRDSSKLWGLVGDRDISFGFPSISHVASARFYEKMLDVVNIILAKADVSGHMCLEAGALVKTKMVGWWPFLSRLMKRVEEISRGLNVEDGMTLRLLYLLDPEYMWFHETCGRKWEELLREVKVDGMALKEWLWRYYALVKADGDSIGRLLDGDVRAFATGLEEDKIVELFDDYIVSSAEGPYRDIIERCLKIIRSVGDVSVEVLKTHHDFMDLAMRVSGEVGGSVDDVSSRIANVVRELHNLRKLKRVPVTPSYHVALSSALMRAALADIALASRYEGFVVYAGGDDLLAFIPVDRALEFVRRTRLSFAGAELDAIDGLKTYGGFLKLNGAFLPMLSSVGRSYVVYIAHYYYPLSTLVSRSAELLDEAKDVFSLKYFGDGFSELRSAKDVLVVAYNPRGSEEVVLLPLTWRRPLKFDASGLGGEIALVSSLGLKLLCYADRRSCVGLRGGFLSRSFFYDFLSEDVRSLLSELSAILPSGKVDALFTAISVVRMLIERNLKDVGDREYVDRIYSEVFEPILPKGGGIVVGTGWFEDLRDGQASDPLVIGLVRAVLLVLSGMR